MTELTQLRVENLEPNPHQPRLRFDEAKLREMADSIKESGILEPIIVRKKGDRYQIIAGERRWRAARLAGLAKVPVIVKDAVDKRVLLESFIENAHRQDLTSVEKENAIYELWKSGEFGSHHDLAKSLGYREQTVGEIIEAKEFRERTGVPETVSTTLISDTRGLDDKTRIGVIQKAERGELSQRPREGGVSEVVSVLKKAPAPLKDAVVKGEVTLEHAVEAVQLYEEVKQEGNPIDDERVARHVEELKREQIEEARESKVRRSWQKEVLTGQKLLDVRTSELPKYWAEELETDPLAVQTAHWWTWNLGRTGNKFDFYTTHYSLKSVDTFIEILRAAGVKTLVDVRYAPASQFRPEYNKDSLAEALKAKGINYIHAPELGVPREEREKLAKNGDWKTFFSWYDLNIIPKMKEILNGPRLKHADKPMAFMCVELDPTKCHRHRLAVALEGMGLKGLDL